MSILPYSKSLPNSRIKEKHLLRITEFWEEGVNYSFFSQVNIYKELSKDEFKVEYCLLTSDPKLIKYFYPYTWQISSCWCIEQVDFWISGLKKKLKRHPEMERLFVELDRCRYVAQKYFELKSLEQLKPSEQRSKLYDYPSSLSEILESL